MSVRCSFQCSEYTRMQYPISLPNDLRSFFPQTNRLLFINGNHSITESNEPTTEQARESESEKWEKKKYKTISNAVATNRYIDYIYFRGLFCWCCRRRHLLSFHLVHSSAVWVTFFVFRPVSHSINFVVLLPGFFFNSHTHAHTHGSHGCRIAILFVLHNQLYYKYKLWWIYDNARVVSLFIFFLGNLRFLFLFFCSIIDLRSMKCATTKI